MVTTNEVSFSKLPEGIIKKLNTVSEEVKKIIETAYSNINENNLSVSFTFKSSVLNKGILSDEERFQQVCFVTRYESLPELNGISIEKQHEKFYITNLDYLRHILNEYRTLLFNQRDSIYFQNLHNFCYKKLRNTKPEEDLCIYAHDKEGNDKTENLMKFLSENTKAIKYIIQNSELDYLYNGILQHADTKFTEKYWNDYYSGELNYIFIKNALLVNETKKFMKVYYNIMNCLTFPVMGAL